MTAETTYCAWPDECKREAEIKQLRTRVTELEVAFRANKESIIKLYSQVTELEIVAEQLSLVIDQVIKEYIS